MTQLGSVQLLEPDNYDSLCVASCGNYFNSTFGMQEYLVLNQKPERTHRQDLQCGNSGPFFSLKKL